jgi:hypothetical protein
MKLLEFVDYLLDPGKLAGFYRQQGMHPEAVAVGGVTIYMVGTTIDLNADLCLLTLEETGGRTAVRLGGIDYVYVLEVDLAIDLLSDSEAGVVSKLDQANRIIHYALYDA